MKNKGLKIFIFIIAVLVFVIGVPILINELYKINSGYVVVWNGADALAYFGTVIGCVGTIILGWIAWQQNKRILQIEERSYLADNAGSALVTEIDVKGAKDLAVNLKSEHVEQIVFSREFEKHNDVSIYSSFEVLCKLLPLNKSQHIALVRVKSLRFNCFSKEKKISVYVHANNTDTKYSRVEISKDFDKFKITVIMTPDEKQKIIDLCKKYYSEISIDMELSLVTDKFVNTSLRCWTKLGNPDYDEKEQIYSHFKQLESEPPICYWNEATLINKNDIMIKELEKL